MDVLTVIINLPQVVASAGRAERHQLARVMTGCLASLTAVFVVEREEAERVALEQAAAAASPVNADDELLSPEAALEVLGLRPDRRHWLLEATKEQKFRVKLGQRTVLFERPGLVRWFKSKRRPFDAGRS